MQAAMPGPRPTATMATPISEWATSAWMLVAEPKQTSFCQPFGTEMKGS